jgi:hypothetical protein
LQTLPDNAFEDRRAVMERKMRWALYAAMLIAALAIAYVFWN